MGKFLLYLEGNNIILKMGGVGKNILFWANIQPCCSDLLWPPAMSTADTTTWRTSPLAAGKHPPAAARWTLSASHSKPRQSQRILQRYINSTPLGEAAKKGGGVKALMARPLRKELFCGFPYKEQNAKLKFCESFYFEKILNVCPNEYLKIMLHQWFSFFWARY